MLVEVGFSNEENGRYCTKLSAMAVWYVVLLRSAVAIWNSRT
jgi:hypothetical protein